MYLKDGSARTIVRAATPRQTLQIQLAISPSNHVLIQGQPVPALTLSRQAPGKVAIGVLLLSYWCVPTAQAGIEPRSPALEVDVSCQIFTSKLLWLRPYGPGEYIGIVNDNHTTAEHLA